MSSATLPAKPVAKQRRPPPPKPPPYKPVREKSSSKPVLPSNELTPPNNEMTPPTEGNDRANSPSILRKANDRPRLNTPVYETNEGKTAMPPLPLTLTPPPVTPPIRPLSPKPYFPMENECTMTVVSQSERPGDNYSEVTLKGTMLPSELSSLDFTYDHTSHVNKAILPPGSANNEYSTLSDQSSIENLPPAPSIPQYTEIDLSKKKPKLVTLPNNAAPERNKTPPPITPPKPYRAASTSPDNKSPLMRHKPPVPNKPPALKQLSPTPIQDTRRSASPVSPIRSKSPVRASNNSTSPVRGSNRSTSPIRASNSSTSPVRSNNPSDVCEIDIDAIIMRSQMVDKKETHEYTLPATSSKDIATATNSTVPHMATSSKDIATTTNSTVPHTATSSKVSDTGSTTIPTPSTRRVVAHIYDDINEVKLQRELEKSEAQGKRVKEPPKRRAPPPPIPKGSPPIQRRKVSPPSSKSLTLGRTPRTVIQQDDSPVDDSPKLPKKSLTSASPGLKSKFKTFFRGGSRDDSFLRSSIRGSLKKSKSKPTTTSEEEAQPESKAKTLPNRPRGKSVDPFIGNSTAIGAYSLITMGSDEEEIGMEQSCVPYTVIDVDDVNMRSKRGNKDSNLRRSRSMDHLYDFAQFGKREKRSPSPLANKSSPTQSPSHDASADMDTHIYAAIDKVKLDQMKETVKEEEELKDEVEVDKQSGSEKSMSPPPPIPPFNAHLYAVVSKSVDDSEEATPPPSEHVSIATPPSTDKLSPPTQSKLNRRNPPPAPSPYNKPPAIVTTPTKAASKYSHLLTSSPPTHTPPVPPTSKDPLKATKSDFGGLRSNIHDYEQVDFDNPLASLDLISPSTSVPPSMSSLHGNLRDLKPKDRPAPPPPYVKKAKSIDESARSTPNESPNKKRTEGHIPMFLFNDSRVTSFIEAGDTTSQPSVVISPSASSSTISSVMEQNEYDSDASTDWDPSSHEEDDEDNPRVDKVPKSKIFYIAHEILTTERTFVKGLGLLHNDFRKHMLSANSAHEKVVATEETLTQILSNIGSLYMLNSDFLKELEERMSKWDNDPRLGDIFVKRAPYLKMYSQYISNFDTALKTLEEQQKKNPLFAQVMKEFEAEPKCANLTVAAYLLETVQRIPRYKLLLADYIKHLPEDSTDKEDSEKALSIITSVATHVNETIRQMDNFRKTIEVSKKLIGDVGDSLLSPHRKLLKEGELVKSSRKEKQPRMFFLFTDLLIYASAIPPANTTFRVIKRIPLDGMRVQLLDDPELKYGFQIISTCKSFRLDASSTEDRQQWLLAFESAIKEHTQRLQSRLKNRQSLLMIDDSTDQDNTLGSLAPPWLPDSSVSMCQLCSIHFTVTRRRHHCRACGQIFCGECSSYLAPLAYKNNKLSRVCQTCYSVLTEGGEDIITKVSTKRRQLKSKISMPSVLTEVRARDQSAQVSGYLFYREDKSRQWKKKWFVVYNLVMYEFKRHEDVSAQKSIPLPSYAVRSPAEGISDPLVFSLQHSGAGRVLFKTENESQLDSWLEVLYKAVKGES